MVSVVLVVVWVGSVWYFGRWCGTNGYVVFIWAGRVNVRVPGARAGLGGPPGWLATREPAALFWWFQRERVASETWTSIPIWPVAMIAVIVTVAAWRLDTLARRRSRIGCCPKCGYDRAGLAGASPCPECDAPAPAPPPTPTT